MAIELITQCEGFRAEAYQDSVGIWTIGIGTARTLPSGMAIHKGYFCTLAQAQVWLQAHLLRYVYPAVNELELCSSGDVPDAVYAALCSFGYNVGTICFTHDSFMIPVSKRDWGTFNEDTRTGTGLVRTFLQYTKTTIDKKLVFNQGLYNRRIKEIKYMLGEK